MLTPFMSYKQSAASATSWTQQIEQMLIPAKWLMFRALIGYGAESEHIFENILSFYWACLPFVFFVVQGHLCPLVIWSQSPPHKSLILYSARPFAIARHAGGPAEKWLSSADLLRTWAGYHRGGHLPSCRMNVRYCCIGIVLKFLLYTSLKQRLCRNACENRTSTPFLSARQQL